MDLLTLAAAAMHQPNAATAYIPDSGIPVIECAYCAYVYVSRIPPHRVSTLDEVLGVTTFAYVGSADRAHCRACKQEVVIYEPPRTDVGG